MSQFPQLVPPTLVPLSQKENSLNFITPIVVGFDKFPLKHRFTKGQILA